MQLFIGLGLVLQHPRLLVRLMRGHLDKFVEVLTLPLEDGLLPLQLILEIHVLPLQHLYLFTHQNHILSQICNNGELRIVRLGERRYQLLLIQPCLNIIHQMI